MAPGKTAEDNLRFITFIVNTLMAVYHHNGLLKASIMSATNAIAWEPTKRRPPSFLLSWANSSRKCWTI